MHPFSVSKPIDGIGQRYPLYSRPAGRRACQLPACAEGGGLIFVSGVSSRRHDNTHAGVSIAADGSATLDIRAQTRAVIENIRVILEEAGAGLEHLIDSTVFLVDMKDYAGMNEVYNEFFDAATGPTRTTVAVHQLPHPNLLIEIKAVAVDPGFGKDEG